jgi:hypothetical protein
MSDVLILADIFGWIGNVGYILGLYYLANKKKPIPSMWWNVFGNTLYVFYSILLHTPSLVVLSVLLIGMNLYGIHKWKIENKG